MCDSLYDVKFAIGLKWHKVILYWRKFVADTISLWFIEDTLQDKMIFTISIFSPEAMSFNNRCLGLLCRPLYIGCLCDL